MDNRSPARKAAGLLFTCLAAWTATIAAAPGDPLGPAFDVTNYRPGYERVLATTASATGYRVFWAPTNSLGSPNGGLFQDHFAANGQPLAGDLPVPGATDNIAAAAAPDGRHVTVRKLHDNGYISIRAQRYAGNGSPIGPEFEVTAPMLVGRADDISEPRVAMNAAGQFVVTWVQRKATGTAGSACDRRAPDMTWLCLGTYQTKVMARRYEANGAAGELLTVVTRIFSTAMLNGYGEREVGLSADSPEVAIGADGRFAVSWLARTQLELNVHNTALRLRQYDAAGKAGPEHPVEDTRAQARQSLLIDDIGNTWVAYRTHRLRQTGYVEDFWLRRFSSTNGRPAGPRTSIENREALPWESDEARLFAGQNGAFNLVWKSSDQQVLLQAYAAGGIPAGGRLVLDTGAPPSVTTFAATGQRLLVTWNQSFYTPLWDLDVRARLFELP